MKHTARWIALGVAVVVVAIGVVLALNVGTDPQAATNRSQLVGKRAPAFSLPTVGGERVRLADFAGKSVVVNFWNTWCIPCRQEYPALQKFQEEHAADDSVVMVGIVRDDTERAVRSWVRTKKPAWTVAFDPKAKTALDFGTRGQPETYVIGPDGVIAGAQYGPVTVANLDTMLARAQGTG